MYGNKYDTIISGGFVVDRTGSPGTYADVAVLDGKIAALGNLEGSAAKDCSAKGPWRTATRI